MKNLKLPNIDNVKLWEDIVSHRRNVSRELLTSYKSKVFDRYKDYERNFTAPDNIKPLCVSTWSAVKEELRSLYGNNVEFNKAKKSLLSTVRCPYCTLSRPNTLDHYYDKSDYPEFSVFAPNLVPCCSECNSIKGTMVFTNDNKRPYIHFYLDKLPKYKFLFVKFNLRNKIPEVLIELRFENGETMKDQIKSHFTRLNLLDKYKDAINEKISTVIEEIQAASKDGENVQRIRGLISNRYVAFVNKFGENYWETCMYEGILSSQGFIETII